jgi:hypothetical protein
MLRPLFCVGAVYDRGVHGHELSSLRPKCGYLGRILGLRPTSTIMLLLTRT